MSAETAFRAALLDASAPVPADLVDGGGRPAGRRYAVYRNNVVVSLGEALAKGFPATRRLLGPEAFARAAGTYLRRRPPTSPVLTAYGADFADFLDAFAPLAPVPWIGDVARLEYALRLSYHAADHVPADPAPLLHADETALAGTRLTLAPSVRLLASRFPVVTLWREGAATATPPRDHGQEIVVLRHGFDPSPRLLPPGGHAVLARLMAGDTLGQAMTAAPETDLAALLAPLLETRAIAAIAV